MCSSNKDTYFYVGNHANSIGLVDIHASAKFTLSKTSSLMVKALNFSGEQALASGEKSLGTEIDIVYKKKFKGFTEGITATASGFYAPQGREVRLKSSIDNMHETLTSFNYDGNKITNFEMESSALYYLGQTLGHNTLTICAIIGNRINKTQSSDYKSTIDKLIIELLERI